MNPRFFCEPMIASDEAELIGSEHQHLSKVLRLQAGDEVTLFDGSGFEFAAKITDCSRNSTKLAILSREEVDRELPFQLTMAVALPKGDRQQWLVEKCVELGVTRLVPLTTKRGVAQPKDKALQRLQRWIVAASKQCRRNRLMEVAATQTVEQFVNEGQDQVLFAHPSGEQSFSQLKIEGNVSIAVGPEGGFTDDEVELGRIANCRIISLGERILRIETAAVAIAAGIVFGNQRRD